MRQFLLALLIFISSVLSSQAPQGFNYQAVVRDNAGLIIPNRSVGIKINIHSGSGAGAIVYSEIQNDTTNQFGLLNLIVGEGTAVNGTFSNIAWASGIYYIEVMLDITGGINYQSVGAGRLLSVPYALYAASTPNIDIYDTTSRTRIQFGIGSLTNKLGTSEGIHCKLSNDTLEWGFQATYVAGAKSVMLYVYDTISGTNQIVQLNPDNVALRSRDAQGHETQLRLKADAGISVMTDSAASQYFLPATPPTAANQVIASQYTGGSWKTSWQDNGPGRDTIFYPLSGDVVNVVSNYYTVISPLTPLQSLTIGLPLFARDEDVIELKFENTITSLSYANGTVSHGSLTTVDLSRPYEKLKFRGADGIWH
jgi:hypothetical protein